LALARTGELYAWGENTYGQIGNDAFSRASQPLPTRVVGYPGEASSAYDDGPCAPVDITSASNTIGANPRTYQVSGVCINLEDDGYDGTLESMLCIDVPVTEAISVVSNLEVTLGLDHERVGDLVVKLVAPDGDVYPLLSRPGLNEGTDDGSGCCGNTGTLSSSYPVILRASASTSAEDMGQAGGATCSSNPCEFAPACDDALPNATIDAIYSEVGQGTWKVCVGDAASGSEGSLSLASVTFTHAPL
jgi:subtilisin-like proprotein convertase family protein